VLATERIVEDVEAVEEEAVQYNESAPVLKETKVGEVLSSESVITVEVETAVAVAGHETIAKVSAAPLEAELQPQSGNDYKPTVEHVVFRSSSHESMKNNEAPHDVEPTSSSSSTSVSSFSPGSRSPESPHLKSSQSSPHLPKHQASLENVLDAYNDFLTDEITHDSESSFPDSLTNNTITSINNPATYRDRQGSLTPSFLDAYVNDAQQSGDSSTKSRRPTETSLTPSLIEKILSKVPKPSDPDLESLGSKSKRSSLTPSVMERIAKIPRPDDADAEFWEGDDAMTNNATKTLGLSPSIMEKLAKIPKPSDDVTDLVEEESLREEQKVKQLELSPSILDKLAKIPKPSEVMEPIVASGIRTEVEDKSLSLSPSVMEKIAKVPKPSDVGSDFGGTGTGGFDKQPSLTPSIMEKIAKIPRPDDADSDFDLHMHSQKKQRQDNDQDDEESSIYEFSGSSYALYRRDSITPSVLARMGTKGYVAEADGQMGGGAFTGRGGFAINAVGRRTSVVPSMSMDSMYLDRDASVAREKRGSLTPSEISFIAKIPKPSEMNEDDDLVKASDRPTSPTKSQPQPPRILAHIPIPHIPTPDEIPDEYEPTKPQPISSIPAHLRPPAPGTRRQSHSHSSSTTRSPTSPLALSTTTASSPSSTETHNDVKSLSQSPPSSTSLPSPVSPVSSNSPSSPISLAGAPSAQKAILGLGPIGTAAPKTIIEASQNSKPMEPMSNKNQKPAGSGKGGFFSFLKGK
jgi:hypothetical protein